MIVVPMAGLSSRFFNAGFTKPKYQLTLNSESIFSWSVKSFERYFLTDKFVFIYRDVYNTKEFLKKEIKNLGIRSSKIVALNQPTAGQAETVYLGIKDLDSDEELFIFNIDSRTESYIKPSWLQQCDGYLEVFHGSGNHWSFAKPLNSREVSQTTEKIRISDLCSDGLYYFREKRIFDKLFEQAVEEGQKTNSEYYIAPLYNNLISSGGKVFYDLIPQDQISFCGTPEEYQSLLSKVQL